jgi:rhodanese-related sulfurtransferase
MRPRHPFVQALLLIVLAFVLAVVTNAFASRTRRLVLPGFYPNALRVPPRVPERVLPTPITPAVTTAAPAPITAPVVPTTTGATTTVAPAPLPGQAPIPASTTTVAQPAATPTPVPAQPAAPAFDLAKYRPHPDKAYVEIGGDEAAALYRAGMLFLDARRTSVFEEGHIAGARSFSVWEADIDDKVNALYEQLQDDQNKPIVIYCSGGACEDSHMLAQKLWGIQFNNVYVYKDGFPDWQQRGGAVKTGGQP